MHEKDGLTWRQKCTLGVIGSVCVYIGVWAILYYEYEPARTATHHLFHTVEGALIAAFTAHAR